VSWFGRLPKVELHVHLEGAIPADALAELVAKYGGEPREVSGRLAFRTFPEFIAAWVWKNGFLRELDDFTLIAEAMARALVAENVLYAEVFYSPPDFARHGLAAGPLTAAIRRGLARVPEIEIALVADLVRDFGPARAARTLAEVSELRSLGVIGVGIGGSEHEHPAAPFRPVFETARREGLFVTAHAGEAAGADSVWQALRELGVSRIGHGVRSFEDPALLDYLVEHRVPLEMCPISNVKTGVVRSLREHPIRRYFDRGVVVTVNTDDPGMFGNSLSGELEALHRELGFSFGELARLMRNAVDASWAPDAVRTRLRRALASVS
jgi:adenosine deaminase